MKAKRLSRRNYRMDHEDFGEVQRVTFAQGELIDFGQKETDPLTLDETGKVELDAGGQSGFLPFFYHCKENYYTREPGDLLPNEALKHGAMAFGPDMKVKVMSVGNVPKFIIGHGDNTPRRCLNYVKMTWKGWSTTPVFTTDPAGNYFLHFRFAERDICCTRNQPCPDPAGEDLNCTKKAIRLCGTHEVQFGSVMYSMCDWLIELGPIMLIVLTYAIGLPLPYTGQIWVQAAPYNKDLREEAIAFGEAKDARLPEIIFMPIPSNVLYPGFYEQTELQKMLWSFFGGWVNAPQPRWIYTDFYAQDWQT